MVTQGGYSTRVVEEKAGFLQKGFAFSNGMMSRILQAANVRHKRQEADRLHKAQ
jgi:hypothetical protein